jgi:hypothetical protein
MRVEGVVAPGAPTQAGAVFERTDGIQKLCALNWARGRTASFAAGMPEPSLSSSPMAPASFGRVCVYGHGTRARRS